MFLLKCTVYILTFSMQTRRQFLKGIITSIFWIYSSKFIVTIIFKYEGSKIKLYKTGCGKVIVLAFPRHTEENFWVNQQSQFSWVTSRDITAEMTCSAIENLLFYIVKTFTIYMKINSEFNFLTWQRVYKFILNTDSTTTNLSVGHELGHCAQYFSKFSEFIQNVI